MNSHGDDLYKYKDIRINFSSNIWGHADLSKLKSFLALHLELIEHYPEPDAHSLEEMLADRLGINADEVLVTNGATEAIYLINLLFSDYQKDFLLPTFSVYQSSYLSQAGLALSTFHTPMQKAETVSRERMPLTTLHWRCNPNNPTGEWRDVSAEIEQYPKEDFWAIDQSYEDYTLQPMLTDKEIVKHPNVLLLHSMTKKYCIPGLRLGYVTGNASLIARLRNLKPEWSVNALALEAGKWLLSNQSSLIPDVHWLLQETSRFQEAINGVEGFEALPSTTNFFMIKCPCSSSALKEFLAEKGLLVRDCSNFEGLEGENIRVATQLPEENDELVRCLSNYTK